MVALKHIKIKSQVLIILFLISGVLFNPIFGQDTLVLCNFDNYSVIETQQTFQLLSGKKVLVSTPNHTDLRLKFNEETGMILMNDICLNCSLTKRPVDPYYSNCNNNIQVEVIPINDSLRIVNHFQRSKRCSNQPLRSKRYPNEDSIINSMSVYPTFEFGFSKSCIITRYNGKKIAIAPAIQYDFIQDLIIGFEFEFDGSGNISNPILRINKLVKNVCISKRLIKKGYLKSKSDLPLKDIDELSDRIIDSKVLNRYNFAIQTHSNWYRYSYGLDNNRIFKRENIGSDSIQFIPFFDPAIIMHYADSSVLEISHQRIKGSIKFDELNVSNYFAKGINNYISMEIIVFTFDQNRHIIIYHNNGHPHYGKFKIYEGPDPISFFALKWHELNPNPIESMVVLGVH